MQQQQQEYPNYFLCPSRIPQTLHAKSEKTETAQYKTVQRLTRQTLGQKGGNKQKEHRSQLRETG